MARGTMPIPRRQMRRICVLKERLPAPGFQDMEGVAFYLPTQGLLKLLICFHTKPDNFGPVPMVTESFPWPARDTKGMRVALQKKMAEVRQEVLSGTLPERGIHLEQCDPAGDPSFLETTCAKCRCPYCEISTSG